MRDAQASKIAAWELFATNLQPLLEEMPYLQPFHDRIQGLIEQARELDQQQERVRVEARDLTRRRHDVEKEAENLRARASDHLRATFGFTSEHLIPFGITPRRSARRAEPDAAAGSEPGGH